MKLVTFLGTVILLVTTAAPSAAAFSTTVLLHDQPSLHIAPDTMSVREGEIMEIAVEVPAGQSGAHDLKFDGYEEKTQLLQPGQGAMLTFTADEPGTFEYYCTVPGHKQAGMRGVLTVQGTTPATNPDDGASKSTPGLAGAIPALAIVATALVVRRRRR